MRKVLFSFILCVAIWGGGLAWFIAQIPAQPSDDPRIADAIVILTGGKGRLEYGLSQLASGKGLKLFISGVGGPANVADLLRHAAPEVQAKLAGMEDRIALGRRAENTIGNAEETARWLKKENCRTIRLVTSNYHMPRSVNEFEEITDIDIIPDPVFADNFDLANWWSDEDSRDLLLSEYHKYIASELRHWLISVTRRPK